MNENPEHETREPFALSRRGFLRLAGFTGGVMAAGPALLAPGTAHAATRRAESVTTAAATNATATGGMGGPILSGTKFPIGLYWPPPPFQTTVERYQEIVDAGFTFSHSNNYLYADVAIAAYVCSIADQVGLQVLVDDPNIRWLVDSFTIADTGGDFTLTVDEATTVIRNALNTYQLQSPWSIQDGQLLFNGGSGDGTVGLSKAGATWTDYTFAFDTVPLETGAGGTYAQAGWAFRAKDTGNCYVWLLAHTASTAGLLNKAVFVNGSPTLLPGVTLPFPVTAGTSYHVETKVSGTTITTSINGTVVDTTTDSTYSQGPVGFREAGTESARFDNVVVTDPTGKVLLSDDFSSGLGQWNVPTNGGYTSFAGFDLYDEPAASEYPTLAHAVAIVESLAPDVLPFINLLPDSSGGSMYSQAVTTMKPLEVSFDRYPILASGEDTGYFQNWAEVRSVALQNDLPSWVYIQSVGFAGVAVPTGTDILWQINISLAYGCKCIQYFTYWTPDPARGQNFTGALLSVDGERGPLYYAAKEINNNYLAPLGKQLLPLVSELVEAANLTAPPSGLPAFTADAYIASTTGSPAVLGRFRNPDSSGSTRWLLVANYSRTDPAVVGLTVGDTVTAVDRYDPTEDRYTPVPKTHLGALHLGAGAAQFFRLTTGSSS